MDECPDAPVEAGDATELLHLFEQSVYVTNPLGFQIYETSITVDVFSDECAAGGPRGQDAEVAAKPAPFGEVVGDVECAWGGGGVFIVDEGDGFGGMGGC